MHCADQKDGTHDTPTLLSCEDSDFFGVHSSGGLTSLVKRTSGNTTPT